MKEQRMQEYRVKRIVPVLAHFDEEGKITPKVIEFDEQHRYTVAKVLDQRRAACESVGGVGIRFTCLVCPKKNSPQVEQTYLWLEKGVWFVEERRYKNAVEADDSVL